MEEKERSKMNSIGTSRALSVQEDEKAPIDKITIGQLYKLFLKIMAAGFLAGAPIAFAIWLVNYIGSH